MKRHLLRALPVALAAVLAASAHGAAQQQDQPRQNPMMRNPVAVLIANAQTLALTDSQSVQIRAIADQLDTTNAPVLAELAKYRPQGGTQGQAGGGYGGGRGMGGGGRGMGGGRRGGGEGGAGREMAPEQRQRFEQMRPLLQQLRQNNMAALMQVYALLGPDQLQKAQSLLPQRQMGNDQNGGAAPPQ